MKKIATNTLATLILVSVINLSTINPADAKTSSRHLDKLKALERVFQHHDRKLELRASVLGISPDALRMQLREKSLDTIVKKHGFKNRLAYYTAVAGKIKHELHRRGWSERKIEEIVQKRFARLSVHTKKAPAFSV